MATRSPARITLTALAATLLLVAFPAFFSATPGPTWTNDYRRVNPAQLANRIDRELTDPTMSDAAYWQSKPPLGATFAYPRQPHLSGADRTTVERLKQGEFQANRVFPWKPLGVPPPWDENPFESRTFDFYRHSLRWTVPLANAWACEQDRESLALLKRIVSDWIRANSVPPGASAGAWGDHAASYRMRIMCWFWELWRRDANFDREFARLLLASVYQHALYLADARNYRPTSNHAIHMDGSLLAAAITFPEFKDARRWEHVANDRLVDFVARNFSPEGFNLEQSPSYHWYVVERLGEIAAFLRANGQPIPETLAGTIDRAAGVWPYLIRPDGNVANVGDSELGAMTRWRQRVRAHLGRDAPPAPPSTIASPRDEAGNFMLSFRAGYAIFTSYPLEASSPTNDTYALFRCNSWRHSGHCHCDGLSFELFGLGREWLVDSGKFNYETRTPRRRYMRSSRAHNVVLIDNRDFTFHPIELVESGRTDRGDHVTARHHLPGATHVRRFEFLPPRSIRLTDQIESADDQAHIVAQLFHIAPGLKIEVLSPRSVRLLAEDGARCLIEQQADAGEWSEITGQTEPLVQGWYSRRFNEIQPSPVLYYTTPSPVRRCKLVTQISIEAP